MDQHPIRALRAKRGLSLADAAREIGTTKGNLGRIERGIHGASDPLKRRIAEWSGNAITPNDLVMFAPEAQA